MCAKMSWWVLGNWEEVKRANMTTPLLAFTGLEISTIIHICTKYSYTLRGRCLGDCVTECNRKFWLVAVLCV